MLSTTDWPGNRRVAHLWQINTDGTGLRRLVERAGAAARRALVARRHRRSPSSRAASVFVMPADGGTPRQVSKRTGVSDIAWHPDGASIYFLALDPPTDAERERQRLRGDIVVLDETSAAAPMEDRGRRRRRDAHHSGPDYIFAYRIAADGDRIIISRRPTRLPADTDRMELWNIARRRLRARSS